MNTSSQDWRVSGGGVWEFKDGVISVAPETTAGWNRSFVYTGEKYKNFILEGTFTITEANGSFVGFALYKKDAALPVAADNGYYVIIENNGRVATYNNVTEFGPRNIMAQNFNVAAPFTFRVVSIGEFLSVSVNGKSVYTIRDPRCDLEAGYSSILAANNTMQVENLWIMPLDQTADYEEVLYEQANDDKIAVEKFTKKDQIKLLLPDEISIKDTGGNVLSVPVTEWRCYDYNAGASGYYTFTGQISGRNPYKIVPQIRVFVRAAVDLSDLQKYYDFAKSLRSEDYSAETWEQVEIYMEMAEDVMLDKFLAQSDIGVAVMRLSNALAMLENIVTDKSDLSSLISSADQIIREDYMPYSVERFETALEDAKQAADTPTVSQEKVNELKTVLENAINALEKKGDKVLLEGYLDSAKNALLGNKTPVSKLLLEDKIKACEMLLEQKDVSEKAITMAVEEIDQALEKLQDSTQNEEKSPENTQKGCNSSIGAAINGCGSTLAALTALFFKKRKK